MSQDIQFPQYSADGLPITYVPNPFAADGAPADSQWKNPVHVASTGNLVLSGLQTVDGAGLMEGDRVLVKDQVLPQENGIYVASATAWRRAPDCYLWEQFVGAVVAIEDGLTNMGKIFVCQVPVTGTVGTTPNYWIPVSTSSGSLGAFTPLRAIVSDAVGTPQASPTTAQEIAFVSGVTSAIQPQLAALANQSASAFSIAVDGTNAAAGAQSTANTALSTANSAWQLAQFGTNTGTYALNVATSGSNLAAAAYVLAEAGTTIGSQAYNYAIALGDKYVRTTRFAEISSGTSGTVALPANSSVVLDDFGGTTDAVVTSLVSGRPAFSHVFTTAGAIVTTTFDSSGAYAFSGTPDVYSVALVYRVRQKLSQFDSTGTDIIGGYDVEALDSITGTPNQVLVNGTTGLPQYGGVVLTLPQDIGTNSSPTFAFVYAGNIGTSSSGSDAYARSVAESAYALAQIGTNTGTAALNAAATAQSTADTAYFIAQVGTNTGTAAYTLAQSGSNVAWSAWVLANTGTELPQSSYDLALAAYHLAQIGTNTGSTAYSVANSAWALAQIGTNTGSTAYSVAQAAYALAVVGTDAADNAQTTANTALADALTAQLRADEAHALAVSGTNTGSTAYSVAQSAYALAQIGTNTGSAAYSVAQTAYSIAQIGTNTGSTAYSVAQSAWALAQIGTNTGTAAYTLAQSGSSVAWEAYLLAQSGTVPPPLSTLPDVNIPLPLVGQILSYDGSIWQAAYPATEVSHAGFVYYLDGTFPAFPGYELLTTFPLGGTEVVETATGVTSAGSVLIDQYLSGTFGRTALDAGIWEYNTYGYASGNNSFIQVRTYVLSGTTETHLWDTDSPVLSTTVGLVSSEVFGTHVAINLSDRLLLRYYGVHTGAGARNISLVHGGFEYYTHIHTPLGALHNDLAGLQGGDAGSNAFYHLSALQYAQLDLTATQVAEAYALAQIGTNTGSTAYSVAQAAYALAQIGTNTGTAALAAAATAQATADSAYFIAQIGTNTGTAAYTLAESGSNVAWSAYLLAQEGTLNTSNVAFAAYALAQIGTNTGSTAYSVAQTAYSIAQIGTNTGSTAYSVAESAWALAQIGTNTGSTAYSVAQAAYALAQLGTVIPPLSTLPDVFIPAPQSGQVLTFEGSYWEAYYPQVATAAQGAFTYYLDGASVVVPGYEDLVTTPLAIAEKQETVSFSGSGLTLIDPYISGTLGRTLIDGGIWTYNTFASADAPDCRFLIHTHLYTGTTEQHMWSVYTEQIPWSVGEAEINTISIEVFGTAFPCNPSDRIVVRYYGQYTGTGSASLSLYHSGTVHYSHIHTPFSSLHNDLAGLQGGTTDEFYHVTHLINDGLQAGQNPSGTNAFITASVLQSTTNLASSAYYVAQSGSNTANSAFALAQIGTNTGTAAYTLAQSGSSVAWQAYLLAQSGTELPQSSYDLALAAYALAQIGTNTGSTAYSVAQSAYTLAQAGTNAAATAQSTADSAFSIAQIGTNTGSTAYSVAQSAYSLAVIGTNAAATAQSTANSAYSIAQIGTNTGSTAYSVAQTAYAIAQIGTNTGTAALAAAATAQSTANSAFSIAQIGTNTGSTAYSVAQTAYFIAQVGTNTGSTAYSVANSAWALAQIGTNVGSTAYSVAQTAFSIAQIGTNTGSSAYSYAAAAYALAQIGTSSGVISAADAYNLASIGTNTGSAAYSVAQTAYSIAQIGTNTGSTAYSVAQTAYAIAQIGTNTGSTAYATAQTAYSIAQIGTNTGSTAYSVAQSAWNLAQQGTYALSTLSNGTTLMSAAPASYVYLCDTSSGSVVLGLPNALGWSGQRINAKVIGSAGSVIVRSQTGSQTIDGALDYTIQVRYESIQVTTDGVNWYIL